MSFSVLVCQKMNACVVQCVCVSHTGEPKSATRWFFFVCLFFWSISGAGVSVFEQKLRVGRLWSPAKLRSESKHPVGGMIQQIG